MTGLIVGVQAVECPVCRARPGRPCSNGRYLTIHRQRRAKWLAVEREEARRREERAARQPAAV